MTSIKGFGTIPVGSPQKAAENKKQPAKKKELEVVWGKREGNKVKIFGIIGAAVGRQHVLVWISANGNRFAQAKNITVQGDQISADWDITLFTEGGRTASVYYAEIQYGKLNGRTENPLILGQTAHHSGISTFESGR